MTASSPDGPRLPKSRRLSLRLVLIVPFLLQLFAAVGLTGWLSLRNGQRAVDEAIAQLRDELTRHIHEYLAHYLETAHLINRINAHALELGQIDERDPAALGRYFWHQLGEFDSAAYVYFGSPEGGAAGAGRAPDGSRTVDTTDVDPKLGLVAGMRYEYSTGDDGGRRDLVDERAGFDARLRPWYQAAVMDARPVWSDVYTLFAAKSLALAAARPVYHPDGRLRGVLGVDLTLAGVGQFLRRLEIGKTGEVFILEPTGLLVATSTESEPFSVGRREMERHWAVDREEPLIAETTRLLTARFGGLHHIDADAQLAFEIDGERHFVQVSPLSDARGLDWLIVTVVPQADFMDSIRANWRNTIWLCLAALAVATVLGLVTSRWIARPIVRLNEVSKGLARGEWDHKVEVRGVREVDELAASFHRMASELRESFSELEQRVEQRIVELREAKEAADRANQAKSRFLANVSHELRTPLAAILGYVELLRETGLGEEAEARLRTIRKNGKHLDQLLSDLLDVSRIEAGRLDLDVKPCELADLLADLGSVFEPAATERGLRLEIETHRWLPWRFDADPLRLRQVLSNLLSNAIKYTDEGSVRLTVASDRAEAGARRTKDRAGYGKADSTTLTLVVEDTGPGIRPEDQERLFQRFTQLDKREGGGFGLGLAITRQLVELMGGRVTVESRVGRGTRFAVRIPVAGCRDWAREERRHEKSGQITLSALPMLRGSVLIADDSRSLQDLCRQMLERWGLDCTTVANGREALDVVRRRRFDVILMDWQMPEMDGLEATLRLRRSGVETPIVALTAAAMAGDRERCLAAGCSDYLTKPIDFKELHRLLGRILDEGSGAGDPMDDDEVAELARAYVRGLPAKVADLRGTLAAADWPPFQAAVHKLVGTVGTYGLAEVYRVAEELEGAAHRQDAATTAALLDQLAAAVDRAVEAT